MLTVNAETVLKKRYYTRDENGVVNEDWNAMSLRVGEFLVRPEEITTQADWAGKFTNWVRGLYFLPNSPTLANANARTGQLAACFVLPIDDTLSNAAAQPIPGMGSGIFDTIAHTCLIHQTGGGTGFSFSRLRPSNDFVRGNQGVSSGPVPFMDALNAATEAIKQGGLRRGANMGILRVDHPDILAFISHKEDLTKLTNFNISVAITNDFMMALLANGEYELINPRTKYPTGKLKARAVWDLIKKRAWSTGEPGIVFIDRMNAYCPVPWMGQYEATNPCGEQPLLPYESCNLGSINLEKFVRMMSCAENTCEIKPRIDWDLLRECVKDVTRLLDNVVDMNVYPLPQIKEVTTATRKIGLGVMGFARVLFKLGIGYGTDQALALAEQIFSFIDFWSKRTSIDLAKEKGQFPARDGHETESNDIFISWFMERAAEPNKHPEADYMSLVDDLVEYGIRNSNTTTVAPTGTISMIADATSGIEPIFALSFKRWQAEEHMLDSDATFKACLEQLFTYSETRVILMGVEACHGSLIEYLEDERSIWLDAEQRAVLLDLTEVFITAHDVTPEDHVYTQAAFQKYNDSATSKTINFPESATEEDVEKAYMLAWATGCKGITVYRDNCRPFQPLSTQPKTVTTDEPPAAAQHVDSPCGCPTPMIVKSEGCTSCKSCNWSACSLPGEG